jgi:hypothetical protein
VPAKDRGVAGPSAHSNRGSRVLPLKPTLTIDGRVGSLAIGCLLFGALIVAELCGGGGDRALIDTRPPPADQASSMPALSSPRPADLAATVLDRPLFSPTRRPPETQSDVPGDGNLKPRRLAGIVVEPNTRFAIFAAIGSKPLILNEGDMVNGWRIDNITSRKVLLSRPGEARSVQPENDPNPIGEPPAPPNALGSEEATAGGMPLGSDQSLRLGSPAAVAARMAATAVSTPVAVNQFGASGSAAASPTPTSTARSAALSWPTFEGEQPPAAAGPNSTPAPLSVGAPEPAVSTAAPLSWPTFEGGQ